MLVAGGPVIQSRSVAGGDCQSCNCSRAALFSSENGESMFLSLAIVNGVEEACATFRNANWEIPHLSSRLRKLADELEALEMG